MSEIIDVSANCGTRAAALFGAGVRTVLRYYSRDTIRPSKRLSRAEAQQLSLAGLRIAAVHEGRRGDAADNFDRATGVADGAYAAAYAKETIGQPPGTTIYFGIDFDASEAQIRDRILPYMRGVADGMAAVGAPGYETGVYGSGRTCRAVLAEKLATRAWLAQSTGWGDYKTFLASKDWALNQGMAVEIAGVACDPNTACDTGTIGDFTLSAVPVAVLSDAAQPLIARVFVNARHGLRLREGPGVQFAAEPVPYPYGTAVHPLKAVAGWTQVDLQGDGRADGFMSSTFLSASLPEQTHLTPAPDAQPAAGDFIHIAELVRQGSTAAGLKLARQTAAKALQGYPHNGCAAHLSALLDQAGIDVPMTFGAGKLSQRIADRGWRPVDCGRQIAGDIGVCFDNDPTPAGADHIYLVISTNGSDEMMIADNQRTADQPHVRYASGKGKTATEYFLRAG